MRGQNAVQKPHKTAKKDDHHDLAGLFPVTTALANGVIFTLVSPKVVFLSSPQMMYCLKTLTNYQHESKKLTELIAS
jgi:hypothetical protein